MKKAFFLITVLLFLLVSCTSQKKLAYLSNLSETGGDGTFTMEIPEYKLQPRDILYITAKAITPDGTIKDFLVPSQVGQTTSFGQGESGGFLYGYDINSEGKILLPVIGEVKVKDNTIEEARNLLQNEVEKIFRGATVECKLLSFKYTVIGEVHSPGSYINYNNYLTVFEAIGRAGGVSDFGRRDKVLVIRPTGAGTKTFSLNLQDKAILSSEAYFLLPNDVIIVEPESKKIFNLNLPTFTFVLTSVTSVITTTLLLINYLGK